MTDSNSPKTRNSSLTTDIPDVVQSSSTIKIYKRRFWMLFLFMSLSTLCGMLYPQYFSVANITQCYYGVGAEAVNWTGNLFLVVTAIFTLPVTFLIYKIGLRNALVLASVLNTSACAMQFATFKPDSFPYILGSSFLGALANVFVLSVPPFIAAVWFPSGELSRACAFGSFGNQLGVALGFIFSPLVVSRDCSKKDMIYEGKFIVASTLTAINALVLILIIVTFQNAPRHPPNLSQSQKQNASPEKYGRTIISLLKNMNFMLIFLIYGMLIGMTFALSTTLNNLVLRYFPNKEMEIGWMGSLYIIAGLVGAVTAGYILDATGKYKRTSVAICGLSLISYFAFSCLLAVNALWLQFITIAISGFFAGSFFPVGFEYGIESTYPESELVSAGVLNISTMVFGTALTEIVSHLLNSKGPISSNAAICVNILICSVISNFLSTDYKRSKKNTESAHQQKSSEAVMSETSDL